MMSSRERQPIDAAAAIALPFPEFSVAIERGRLRLFAQAIGETRPVFFDVDAARSAGYRDIPVPPTFLFSLGLEAPDPFGYLDKLGIDIRQILHGEQSFEYFSSLCAGDSVTVKEKIVDVFSKRNGSLEFLVKRTNYLRNEELTATATSTVVVRHLEEDH